MISASMNAQDFLQYARIQYSEGLTDKTLDHRPDISSKY